MPRTRAATGPSRGNEQSIAFGLVNVPVKIKNLDASKKAAGAPSANFICPEHREKVRQVYVCDTQGKTHQPGHPVDKLKAYPVDGKYVEVDQDELDAIVAEKTKSIAIETFVSVDKIDPLYYDGAYMLWGDAARGGWPTYTLLARAMEAAGMAGVGNSVIAGSKSTKLVVVRWSPAARCLVAHTCKYDEEIRWDELQQVADLLEAQAAPPAANLKMAGQLMAGLAGDFQPDAVEDTFTRELIDLLAKKAAGKKITPPKPTLAPVAAGDDIMAELERSITALRATGKKKAAA